MSAPDSIGERQLAALAALLKTARAGDLYRCDIGADVRETPLFASLYDAEHNPIGTVVPPYTYVRAVTLELAE
jgi:hypothetical protein